MARVPYVQREQLPPEQQKHFDSIAGSRGRVGPNFQTLLNSPEAGDGSLPLASTYDFMVMCQRA